MGKTANFSKIFARGRGRLYSEAYEIMYNIVNDAYIALCCLVITSFILFQQEAGKSSNS